MSKRQDIHKVLIIGSGPIIIGQACEFDYSGTQACKALKKLGYEIVLVNSNPATIMTDPGTADVTYIEPLNVERLTQIIEKENKLKPYSDEKIRKLLEEKDIYISRRTVTKYREECFIYNSRQRKIEKILWEEK